MNNHVNYENPVFEILVFDTDIVHTSLINDGSGTGGSGGLPSETSMTSQQFL